MNAAQDLSIVFLVTQASLPVQIVLLLLFTMSLMSWTYIFSKFFAIRRAKKLTTQFETQFWSAGDLNTLSKQVNDPHHDAGHLARIFEAGMQEFRKGQQSPQVTDPSLIIDGARRAMRAAYQREMDELENHLNFLASTASVSVYIGLFGTVWGIMQSFRGLASVQQATLASVAPGIAEALIATAVGLFAAIPAFVAYNRYIHDIDRICIRFETFIDEFLNILQRQVH